MSYVKKPFHFIKVTQAMKEDADVLLTFLEIIKDVVLMIG
jgi:hypothetical protein